ncbi:translation initiation factor eIF-2B subunit alpha [Emydomyces testavorans]|uniref:Translation initiation factor eIF2B subunit alpha n=1 Tax=Emydomyces testavorans TaxID=2070801 RepID=A0AAF0DL93_9EURO|nr:translation initiation factor eIF-2B subunit alpha [Emydomyces testavorans]
MGNEAVSSNGDSKLFDIVSTYNELLSSDSDLTMPIAAIEALVLLLTHSPSSTISETLDLLKTHTERLKQAIPNPIGLSAGTDLFQRYIISTLQRPGKLGPAGDFNAIRAHLLSHGRLFIKRAKESRDKIAAFGSGFVRDGSTILTNGGSRVVGALLKKVASEGHEFSSSPVRFRVIYVVHNANDANGSQSDPNTEGMDIVLALRSKGVPVATIPESAVAYSMGMVDMVIVGAEGVVENGGIISRMGTYQMGILAKSAGKPFYVVAESHKFVRLYPLGQYDLPINQHVIDFKANEDSVKKESPEEPEAGFGRLRKCGAVDFTPPYLITALITEGGVLTPSAVSEELIKIWF